MVKILYRGPRKVVFMGNQGKETATLRKAVKQHLCHNRLRDGVLIHRHFIEKGEEYIEDKLNYTQRKSNGYGYVKRRTIKVCLDCWKGPRPVDAIDPGFSYSDE